MLHACLLDSGVCWLRWASLALQLSHAACFLCVCAPMSKFPSSYMDIGHIGFSMTLLTQCDLIFNLIASAKTLFLNKSHSQDLGLGLEHILFGHTTQSTTRSCRALDSK